MKKNLNRYGDNQGELELREGIAKYIMEYRGVNAKAHEIIIGTGIQSFLQIILPDIKKKYNYANFKQGSFPGGEYIFRQYNYDIECYAKEKSHWYKNCIQYIRSDDNYFINNSEKSEFLKEARKIIF